MQPETVRELLDAAGGEPAKQARNDFLRFVKGFERPRHPLREVVPANERQVGGTHYQGKLIQPWDYIAQMGAGYFDGAAIKYLSRWRQKGGVDDLKKAQHYIDKLIELENGPGGQRR